MSTRKMLDPLSSHLECALQPLVSFQSQFGGYFTNLHTCRHFDDKNGDFKAKFVKPRQISQLPLGVAEPRGQDAKCVPIFSARSPSQ